MKKESTGHDFAVRKNAWSRDAFGSRCVRLGLVAAMGASLALSTPVRHRAQQRFTEPTVRVTNVTTSGNVVSISADGSLNHAQTWQDPDGDFHVVLVNGQAAPGAARGVKVQRVGNSLELVVPVKRGASVTVQPRGNRLDLVVTGGALNVENFPLEQRREPASQANSAATRGQAPEAERAQAPKAEARRRAATEAYTAEVQQAPAQSHAAQTVAEPPQPAQAGQPAQPQQPAPAGEVGSLGPAQGSDASQPQESPQTASQPPTVVQPAAAQVGKDGFNLLSFLFSLPSMLVLLGVALAGAAALFLRRGRSEGGEEGTGASPEAKGARAAGRAEEKSAKPFQQVKGDRRKGNIAVPFERRASGRGAEDEATRRSRELAEEEGAHTSRAESKAPSASSLPAVIFGSYRIDQEVARLVAGEPHSIEVLSSRASDDRRAVETSLLKALRAPEMDEDGRRRARTALEDYGFVARSCAALLLGTETFERVSAARTLADMKSAQALPFLTEALYDHDPLVRNECVQSLGALGLPSAIGALLDVARCHKDVPASVLGPALTACSVESLELGWEPQAAPVAFAASYGGEECGGGINALVPAVERYEELPQSCDDETLGAALARLESADAETRAVGAQQLAQFQVRRSVEALAAAARQDAEPAVRSAAVTSLGLINHESVFPQVIMALADEAREVRAAAARALSRLSFDRADAYVRLVEMADARALRDVAHACVKAGLAAQAIGRLTSEDRRQAYEAYSLLSLCVSGGEAQPVVEAVETHRDIDTRLTCVQLLIESNQPEVAEQLRRLAASGGVPERVRRSIHETAERTTQPRPVEVG